jgi:FAD/FMN-containing dehydrogenase
MSLKNNTLNKINTIIKKKQNVLYKDEERYCYAQDAMNSNTFFAKPDVVIFVETIEEISDVLKFANKNNVPVVSRGAGTNMVGACTCPNGGIVLNFSKMNKIIDFNPDNMTMKVQPGVIVEDIKKMANSKGLCFPPDPSNFKVSTIGGSIAQSSGGAKSSLSVAPGNMFGYVPPLSSAASSSSLCTCISASSAAVSFTALSHL